MLTVAVWLRMTWNSCPHCLHSWDDSLVPPHLVSVISFWRLCKIAGLEPGMFSDSQRSACFHLLRSGI